MGSQRKPESPRGRLAPCHARPRVLPACGCKRGGEKWVLRSGAQHLAWHPALLQPCNLHPLASLSARYEKDPNSKTWVASIGRVRGNHHWSYARATAPGHNTERQLKVGILRGLRDAGTKGSPEPINAWEKKKKLKKSQRIIAKMGNPGAGHWLLHTSHGTPRRSSQGSSVQKTKACITSGGGGGRRKFRAFCFSPQRGPKPQSASFSIQPVSP